MKLIERKQCPICGSTEHKLFRKGTFDPGTIGTDDFKITDSAYGSLWNFHRCCACGFVLSTPYVPQEDIVEFYSHLKDNEYSAEAEGRTKNFNTVLHRLKKLRAKIHPQEGEAGNRLLDVGAASGIFLDLARNNGYAIEGVEPSEYLVKDAGDRYGLNLFKGTIQEYLEKIEGNGTTVPEHLKFNVITLLDIIEHLVEPDDFMKQVDRLIAPNGLLVLVTPDVDSLMARVTGKRWWHYRIAHINFFNFKALNRLLEKHGYEIILKKKYVWNFSVYYLITRVFPFLKDKRSLQKTLKRLHLKLPLFDSWEIYARKTTGTLTNGK